MSTVYLARDAGLDRLVALKTFRLDKVEGGDDSLQVRERLLREARSAGRLSHPSVVTIHDIVEGGDTEDLYIVMEYVAGSTLGERLAWEKEFTEDEIVALATALASALDHFHSRGVIHRDIKPANVLLTGDGRVKIADFGIALAGDPSLTQDLTVLGTPYYMSPEQILGKPVDARSDIFALGVLLYEIFTRQKPFPGDNVGEVTHRILNEAFVAPDVHVPDMPEEVSDVISRCLASDPDERYASAGAAVRELTLALGREPSEELAVDPMAPTRELPAGSIPASRSLPPQQSWRYRKRRRRFQSWGAAAVVVLLAALAGWYAGREPAEPPGTDVNRLVGQAIGLIPTDPAMAAQVLRLARETAANPEDIDPLLEEAEQRAAEMEEEEGAAEGLAAARLALDEGRFDEAVTLTRELLRERPGSERAMEALELLDSVREAQKAEEAEGNRRAARRAPPRSSASPPRRSSAQEADDAPNEQEVAAAMESSPEPDPLDDPRLTFELASEAPRGTVILFLDGKTLFRKDFSFYKRTGFLRKEPMSGGIYETLTVPPGHSQIRIVLTRHGEAAKTFDVPADFSAGSRLRLRVDLPAEGEPNVVLR